MSSNATEIDPERVIQRYRSDLEAQRHRSVLLEIHTSDLQARISELEAEKAELTKKLEGMAKQMARDEALPVPARDTAE